MGRGRAPCCDKNGGVKKGAWTPEEDKILVHYITITNINAHATWPSLPKLAGLLRCGKSCRLRWNNYLRPGLKRGAFSSEEAQSIFKLHTMLGNKWAAIASHLPGRTYNEIKNFWNTHLKKQLPSIVLNLNMEFSSKSPDMKSESPSIPHMTEWENVRVETEGRLSVDSLLINPALTVKTECDYFLRLWNSGVEDTFQIIKEEDGVESASGITMQEGHSNTVPSGDVSDEQSCKDHIRAKNWSSDNSSSCDMESSDSALKLLLGFPSGGDYMEFLKDEIGDFRSSLKE